MSFSSKLFLNKARKTRSEIKKRLDRLDDEREITAHQLLINDLSMMISEVRLEKIKPKRLRFVTMEDYIDEYWSIKTDLGKEISHVVYMYLDEAE